MDEQPLTPPHVESSSPYDRAVPPRRRRRLVLPAVVAALSLGAVGAGVGYAAVSSERSHNSASGQDAASGAVMQPSYGGSYGQTYGDGNYYGGPRGYTDAPFGGSSPGGELPSPDTGSRDTTAQASGAQLTGLVRIVSTNSYTGSEGVGTGMVLTSDGEVVTNHHVVEDATSVTVTVMASGRTYTARVVGTDANDDVAVLDLSNASGLDSVTPDEDAVSVGDPVTAVGDGNGTVDYLSAATGSVTAADQPVTTQGEGTASSESLRGMIEISSDVVPGYSGGATYDAQGEVLGMTTAATSNAQDPDGYAIPIATVLSVAKDLTDGVRSADYDYAQPAFLGIGLGAGSGTGTTVQGTYDGTPAADAGIGAGDSITSVGGVETTTAAQLRSAIAAHSPGDHVRITWTDTNGSGHSAAVALAKGPVE